jgi:hypothetical protein
MGTRIRRHDCLIMRSYYAFHARVSLCRINLLVELTDPNECRFSSPLSQFTYGLFNDPFGYLRLQSTE